MKNQAIFNLSEKVVVDNDPQVVAVVTAICFRTHGVKYEISWWNHGDLKEAWVDEWRLSKWEE